MAAALPGPLQTPPLLLLVVVMLPRLWRFHRAAQAVLQPTACLLLGRLLGPLLLPWRLPLHLHTGLAQGWAWWLREPAIHTRQQQQKQQQRQGGKLVLLRMPAPAVLGAMVAHVGRLPWLVVLHTLNQQPPPNTTSSSRSRGRGSLPLAHNKACTGLQQCSLQPQQPRQQQQQQEALLG